MYSNKYTYMHVLAALFTIAERRKPKCLSTKEQIADKTVVYPCNKEKTLFRHKMDSH